MSPEQHRIERVDARSDQFSFAVTVWEALFGQRPHAAATQADYLKNVLAGTVASPPSKLPVSPRLVRALRRSLRPAPEARFDEMDALATELTEALAGHARNIDGAVIAAVTMVGALVALSAGRWLGLGTLALPSLTLLGLGASIVLAVCSLRLLGNAHPLSRWVLPSFHATLPGWVLFAWIGSTDFTTGTASWVPLIVAIAVLGSMVNAERTRRWRQVSLVQAAIALLVAWGAWYAIETGDIARWATPGAMLLRCLCAFGLVFAFIRQARRIEAAEQIVGGVVETR